MSLVCTPQTGKVLNNNSSVNSQLVHKKVQLTLVTSGNKIAPQKRKTVKREKILNTWLGRRGNLLRDSLRRITTWRRQPWPTVEPGQGSGITVWWWLNRRRRTGGVSGPDTVEMTNGRRQRRNGSSSYGKKRPQRGTVTRGDDETETSVRSTHSVAPSRWRRTWTVAR